MLAYSTFTDKMHKDMFRYIQLLALSLLLLLSVGCNDDLNEVGLQEEHSSVFTKKSDDGLLESDFLQVVQQSFEGDERRGFRKHVIKKYGDFDWDTYLYFIDEEGEDRFGVFPLDNDKGVYTAALMLVYLKQNEKPKFHFVGKDNLSKLPLRSEGKLNKLSLESAILYFSHFDQTIYRQVDCELAELAEELLGAIISEETHKTTTCSWQSTTTATDWYQYNSTTGQWEYLDTTYETEFSYVCTSTPDYVHDSYENEDCTGCGVESEGIGTSSTPDSPTLAETIWEEIECNITSCPAVTASPPRVGVMLYRYGKKAYDIYKRTGKLTYKNLKDAGLDEIADLADNFNTIFLSNAGGWDRALAVLELLSGLDATTTNRMANKAKNWGSGLYGTYFNTHKRSWENIFSFYVGKGKTDARTADSVRRINTKINGDCITCSDYMPSMGGEREAFKEEAIMMEVFGYPRADLHNRVWSPGKNYIDSDGF